MIKKFIYFIISIGVIALFIYLLIFILIVYTPTRIREKIIVSQETFYLKNEKRGLNYEITSLSKSSRKKNDYSNKESFIYSSGETIFYKIKSDTLFIYTMNIAEYPDKLKTNIVIKQVKINNQKFIEYNKTYKEIGLNKFPSK